MGSFGGTSTRVGEGGGGVSRLILPKMTFWFVGRSCKACFKDEMAEDGQGKRLILRQ